MRESEISQVKESHREGYNEVEIENIQHIAMVPMTKGTQKVLFCERCASCASLRQVICRLARDTSPSLNRFGTIINRVAMCLCHQIIAARFAALVVSPQ